jgi:serine/threonine protein phosphatase PrpC
MANGVALALDFAAGTDLGCQRSNNEDSFGYDLLRRLYVVCDGMGGMAAGEVASAMAVRELVQTFDVASAAGPALPVEERLSKAIRAANNSVRESAAASSQLQGMGTTLVCACLDGSRILIGNVGDSRAYFWREGKCFQITRDHSLLAEQLSQGLITPEMAATSDLQSVITRAIGVAEVVEPDLFTAETREGDGILLASDGLSRYVDTDEIGAMLGSGHPLQLICQGLISIAKERGGADNITCIVLRVIAGSGIADSAAEISS